MTDRLQQIRRAWPVMTPGSAFLVGFDEAGVNQLIDGDGFRNQVF